jgi:hypothetical protein
MRALTRLGLAFLFVAQLSSIGLAQSGGGISTGAGRGAIPFLSLKEANHEN